MNASCTYAVQAEFDDPAVADEWVAWLRDEHLDDVLAAGALDAEVVRWEGESIHVSVRYLFADRRAFTRYEEEQAPRLRDEGLRRFPPERGIRYARAVGAVCARAASAST